MNCYILAGVLAILPTVAGADNYHIEIPFTGVFGNDAYGLYKAGDKITGLIVYDRVYNEDTMGLFEGAEYISLETKLEDYVSPVLYANYDRADKEASFSGARSQPLISVNFFNVLGQKHYLPTLAELLNKRGTFSTSSYTTDGGTEVFSGGSGRLMVDGSMAAPVPEPATWASLAAGLSLASGAAAYRRRRKAKVMFA
ncbi:PEP-CTERM sorting domain-containing protein [Sphingomonas aerophila]|uniref:Ice-binding protein C-terminal domain-containing protein n=1 Tax=Sphingomonas aerophila TaxID=1344948 RepID=A0A7W9BCQ5_9SPHN|nr:PEP-CTERM sorting domain-containing protein [Sphingomonas aerophila]MBB5714792.1 hypothetical protein [Sphingomonas aerophila]